MEDLDTKAEIVKEESDWKLQLWMPQRIENHHQGEYWKVSETSLRLEHEPSGAVFQLDYHEFKQELKGIHFLRERSSEAAKAWKEDEEELGGLIYEIAYKFRYMPKVPDN